MDKDKNDDGAGLIGQVASPSAETEPRLNDCVFCAKPIMSCAGEACDLCVDRLRSGRLSLMAVVEKAFRIGFYFPRAWHSDPETPITRKEAWEWYKANNLQSDWGYELVVSPNAHPERASLVQADTSVNTAQVMAEQSLQDGERPLR